MITAIVFSRDRAMQLDALLRSMPPRTFNTYVLWKATTDDHDLAYLRCDEEHPAVTFYMESADGLPWRILEIFSGEGLACFLTDDSVFYRQPMIPPTIGHEIVCHSFRLGINTTFCYPHNAPQTVPDSLPVWRWATANQDFGYPGSLDGHLFRSSHLRRALSTWTHQTGVSPNEIEDHLNSWINSRLSAEFPLMSCELESSLVGIPANRVNETHPNRVGNGTPANVLCEWYLSGKRINLAAMDFTDVRGAHQDIPLVCE